MTILGCSSPDSVATLEKKLGRTLFWVCMVFFKSQLKKAKLAKLTKNYWQLVCQRNAAPLFLKSEKYQRASEKVDF